MTYELELKYDCLIDIILLSDKVVKTHAAQLPIYQNISERGCSNMTPERRSHVCKYCGIDQNYHSEYPVFSGDMYRAFWDIHVI